MLRSVSRRLRAPSFPTAISLLALSIALTGTAAAAAPQLFAIADKTGANVASVSANGALNVTGSVSTALPKAPFNFPAGSFPDGAATIQFAATTATLAFTGFRVANQSASNTTMSIYQYPETSTFCDLNANAGSRQFLGQFSVPSGQTVDEQLSTPQIVKPIPGFSFWCFVTFASGPGGSIFWTTYNGYVLSGKFTTSTATVDPNASRREVGSGPYGSSS
ncbi:MAG TPA: hypothetical protein VFA66_02505 [Gaiellaceae bacterium]|nr:hypothetical protein [Gaiellaceae bacterium]